MAHRRSSQARQTSGTPQVSPAYQRRGIGTALLAAALDWLRADGATGVTAGSGGRFYIWPGVPRDLPGAVRFFTSRGWQHSHDTLDLVTDLRRYRPPPGAGERAGNRGITITRPVSGRPADVLAFEAATFPQLDPLVHPIRPAERADRAG